MIDELIENFKKTPEQEVKENKQERYNAKRKYKHLENILLDLYTALVYEEDQNSRERMSVIIQAFINDIEIKKHEAQVLKGLINLRGHLNH